MAATADIVRPRPRDRAVVDDGRERSAGAGVGGLAAAIALGRAGVRVRVLERASALEPLGAGISRFPNAIHALRRLGIGGLEGIATASARSGLWRCDGTLLAPQEPAQRERRYGAPVVALHRGDLQAALLNGLDHDIVMPGGAVQSGAGSDPR